jgi:hypothetical protein
MRGRWGWLHTVTCLWHGVVFASGWLCWGPCQEALDVKKMAEKSYRQKIEVCRGGLAHAPCRRPSWPAAAPCRGLVSEHRGCRACARACPLFPFAGHEQVPGVAPCAQRHPQDCRRRVGLRAKHAPFQWYEQPHTYVRCARQHYKGASKHSLTLEPRRRVDSTALRESTARVCSSAALARSTGAAHRSHTHVRGHP